MTKFEQTFAYGSHKVEVAIDFDSLPQESKDFIISYGLKQYLNDGAAVAKDIEGDRNELKADGVQKRLTKLLEGTVKERASGPRGDQEARDRKEIAVAYIKARAQAKGASMPKGDDLAKMIETLWENAQWVEKFGQPKLDEKRKEREEIAALDIDLGL